MLDCHKLCARNCARYSGDEELENQELEAQATVIKQILDQWSLRYLLHKCCCGYMQCSQYGFLPKNLLESVLVIEEYHWITGLLEEYQRWWSWCQSGCCDVPRRTVRPAVCRYLQFSASRFDPPKPRALPAPAYRRHGSSRPTISASFR